MALMFPRCAQLCRNGYFPTDEVTLERALQAPLRPVGQLRICDPCAGRGCLAEAAHIPAEKVPARCRVRPRARRPCSRLLEQCCHMTFSNMISRQSFRTALANPPYGRPGADTPVRRSTGQRPQASEKASTSAACRCCSTAASCPDCSHYVLDDELTGWLSNHFTDCASTQRDLPSNRW